MSRLSCTVGILCLSTLLTACDLGGGGSSSSNNNDTTTPTDNNGGDTGGGSGGGSGGGTNPPPDTGEIIIPTIPMSNERMTMRRYDTDSDGFYETEEVFTYDDAGRVTVIDFRPAAGQSSFQGDNIPFSFGGNLENRATLTYDAEGRIAAMEVEIFERDFAGERVVDRRNVFTYTWDSERYIITDTLAEFYSMDNGGGLQSSLLATIDYTGQSVTGWTENRTNVIAIPGIPDATFEDTVAVSYGENGLPETVTKNRQSGGSNTLTYTWNAEGFALDSVEADSNLAVTRDTVYTYTDAGKIASRTELLEGALQNQTLYNYVLDRLDTITYDTSPVTPDTAIEVLWEEAPCQPTILWATGAEPSFIPTGNEPYLPATGYLQLNFCNL